MLPAAGGGCTGPHAVPFLFGGRDAPTIAEDEKRLADARTARIRQRRGGVTQLFCVFRRDRVCSSMMKTTEAHDRSPSPARPSPGHGSSRSAGGVFALIGEPRPFRVFRVFRGLRPIAAMSAAPAHETLRPRPADLALPAAAGVSSPRSASTRSVSCCGGPLARTPIHFPARRLLLALSPARGALQQLRHCVAHHRGCHHPGGAAAGRTG